MESGRTIEGYQLMCAGNDSYGCNAARVAAGDGFLEKWTNARLETALVAEGGWSRYNVGEAMNAIRSDLGMAYVAHLDSINKTAGGPAWPSRQAINNFHGDVFRNYGAPNVFGGKIADIPGLRMLTGYDWCGRVCR